MTVATGFLDKLIDWKKFELFVRDLYRSSDEVLVEHDVTKTGKSGATRQIDVHVTHKSALHTYTTLIECKSWKHRVDRARIDVMAASLEDLNASKGVIFTTKGYQEGAIEYARFKNIDLFVVRDLTEEEWGKPGKYIEFFVQFVNTSLENIRVANASLLPIVDDFPSKLDITIVLKENFVDESLFLYSKKNGQKHRNIADILLNIKHQIAQSVSEQVGLIPYSTADEKPQVAFQTEVLLDFETSEFRQLRYPFGVVNLGLVEFSVLTSIDQDRITFDRTAGLNFALIVENYLTRQKNFVSKRADEATFRVSGPAQDENSSAGQALENGSILKVYFEPYVSFDLKADTIVRKTNEVGFRLN